VYSAGRQAESASAKPAANSGCSFMTGPSP
jgi:hypothetical protein